MSTPTVGISQRTTTTRIVIRTNQPPCVDADGVLRRGCSALVGASRRSVAGGRGDGSSDRLLLAELPDVPDHHRDDRDEQDDRDRGAASVVAG